MARRKIIRGKDRTGYQASDILAALTDATEADRQSARIEKARILIQSLRFIGQSPLQASDGALYEKMVVWAREKGIDREEHEIPMSVLADMHGDPNLDRVRRSLKRISETRVRWDIVEADGSRGGEQPLLLVEDVRDLKAGTSTCLFTIPAAVRRVILRAREYAMLEVGAISRFSCRYTIRLYEKLALHAELGDRHKEPWTVGPELLAEMVGWSPKDGFKYGVFKRDVLDAAVADMREHVNRFKLSMDGYQEKRGTGRGRPVTELAFKVSKRSKRFEENQAERLSSATKGFYHKRPDERHAPDDLPSDIAIGRAAKLFKRSEFDLGNGWRAALDMALSDPDEILAGHLTGQWLLAIKGERGTDAAFGVWSEAVGSDGEISTDRLPITEPEPVPADPEPKAVTALAVDVFERRKAAAIKEAQYQQWHMDGWADSPAAGLRMHITDSYYLACCDIRVAPWHYLGDDSMPEEVRKAHRQLAPALAALGKADKKTRQTTLKNLVSAVVVWDIEKLGKIARAVLARSPKKSSSKPRAFHEGTVPEVNELTAGEFHDRYYLAGAHNFDDRDLSDDVAD